MPGAVLDAFLKFGFADDPAKIVGIGGGDLVITPAAVLPEMKAYVKGRLA